MDFSVILRCIILFALVTVAVTIKEFPSAFPTSIIRAAKRSKWQTLEAHVSVAKCPKGTIPVRRDNTSNQTTSVSASSDPVHEHAVGSAKTKPKMYGAKATFSVWDPIVEKGDELSISQIWITSGQYGTNDLTSIEVGWQVSPNLYLDNKPRLFIYWTSDTYNATGCYNLQCPGFIQTSSSIVLGGAISPVSTFEGNQYEITVSVWKDQKHRNWWLSMGSNHTLVGYWPAELFSSLAYAEDVQWGGEIVDSHSFGRHTTTQMGSGRFADEGFGKASYVRNLEIVLNNSIFEPVQEVELTAPDYEFYNIKKMFRDDWGTYLFYGGPGFSRMDSGVASLVPSSFSSFFLLFSLF